jgi:hypothetical protein
MTAARDLTCPFEDSDDEEKKQLALLEVYRPCRDDDLQRL